MTSWAESEGAIGVFGPSYLYTENGVSRCSIRPRDGVDDEEGAGDEQHRVV